MVDPDKSAREIFTKKAVYLQQQPSKSHFPFINVFLSMTDRPTDTDQINFKVADKHKINFNYGIFRILLVKNIKMKKSKIFKRRSFSVITSVYTV